MSTPRKQLTEFIEQGAIPAEKIDAALNVLKIIPDGKRWRTFIDHLLLWLSGLALAFALMYFVAYNWQNIGSLGKFGMVEGLLTLAIIAYCKLAENSVASKVSLFVATISLGVLLALYSQTYQTGADPWQLFFNWALLMLPWAIIGRFPTIWILWVALVNVSIVLYYWTISEFYFFGSGYESDTLWFLFIFNTLAFVAWQLLATTWYWLSKRWAIRVLAVGSGAPLTWLVLVSIVFDQQGIVGAPGLVWLLWLVTMYYVYRGVKLDLFMLAGCGLSIITVIVSISIRRILLPNADAAGAWLFIALIMIGMGGGVALWLKNIHQKCR